MARCEHRIKLRRVSKDRVLLAVCRSTNAFTLVEMLISVIIIGIISAGTAQLLFMNSQGSWKLFNKVDSLNGARLVIDRMAMDVRMARNVGDIAGTPFVDGTDVATVGSNQFPTTLNALYGSGQNPPGGWPGSPWPNKPYTLSNTCLIIQIPVFDGNGFPTKTGSDDNLDTYVYQVLADDSDPGTFKLQVASFPGTGSTRPVLNPPKTLLRGIIGPLDTSTGDPKVFQYLTIAGVPQDVVVGTEAPNYTGVIVNLELRRHLSVQTKNRSTIGIKSEIFMRNNTLATVSN